MAKPRRDISTCAKRCAAEVRRVTAKQLLFALTWLPGQQRYAQPKLLSRSAQVQDRFPASRIYLRRRNLPVDLTALRTAEDTLACRPGSRLLLQRVTASTSHCRNCCFNECLPEERVFVCRIYFGSCTLLAGSSPKRLPDSSNAWLTLQPWVWQHSCSRQVLLPL